ncbi:hypothetical protein LOAG_08016 [Loa loa]|uniref:Uncharacterized protein n=1 Tax=Loa loa TaxID=7209 RepID=A0A1S0TWA3_LOALO|nr:hypothetical protein LOAG_08016 [Loa loa]EFO20473.1 hypothetical protein LOAG_08016 [Loa loa]
MSNKGVSNMKLRVKKAEKFSCRDDKVRRYYFASGITYFIKEINKKSQIVTLNHLEAYLGKIFRGFYSGDLITILSVVCMGVIAADKYKNDNNYIYMFPFIVVSEYAKIEVRRRGGERERKEGEIWVGYAESWRTIVCIVWESLQIETNNESVIEHCTIVHF